MMTVHFVMEKGAGAVNDHEGTSQIHQGSGISPYFASDVHGSGLAQFCH